MLNELKSARCKKKELRCDPNGQCWCMRVQARFTHPDDTNDCMSPQEMLNQTSVVMSDGDKGYLQGLLGSEFIRSDMDNE